MIRNVICLYLLMVGGFAQAHEEFGCPYPSTIRYVEGFFLTSDMRLPWQSSKVQHRDFVDRFIGAIFIPEKDQERENGRLDKCVYRTCSGQSVALRPGKADVVEAFSLTSTLHWQIAKDPLEQEVYICQDSQPDNCAFTLSKPRL
ncbi:DUF3757 domain-containing protein [Pseudomonas sp. Leaf59]|uniref:DUF3757 domain-containing protein n=1 Tax=Pseudomonas sp. Leaf59 TaxID=2876556 RepID=UPI001E42D2FA|nr:DUF3757 domain-containing protein [Pseudomonas sp. Leaf59]